MASTSAAVPTSTSGPASATGAGSAGGATGGGAGGGGHGFEHLLPGEGNLWGSILDSVSKRREKGSVPTRQVIILGERGNGTATVVSQLAGSSKTSVGREASDKDLGMGFTTVDIRDEGEEDTVARLAIHQIPSPEPPYSSLLPLVLTPAKLKQSLVVVLLPLSHPHDLLASLLRWLVLLSSLIDSIRESSATPAPSTTADPSSTDGSGNRGEVVVEEAKELLESSFRSYVEPGSSTSTTTTHSTDVSLPLPPGTLVSSLGVQLLFVLTNSDALDALDRPSSTRPTPSSSNTVGGGGYLREDDVDQMFQILRTVALRYGAGTLCTSRHRPDGLVRLRDYVLHRLFGSPATGSSSGEAGNEEGPSAATKRGFAFRQRANVVDRDGVMVPIGWDSWGKIKVTREGFEPAAVGQGWEDDVEWERRRRTRAVAAGQRRKGQGVDEEAGQGQEEDEQYGATSACRMWASIVGAPDDRPIRSTASAARLVSAPSEQDFFRSQYEKLSKERDRPDPRAHFQQPSSSSAAATSAGAGQKRGLMSPEAAAALVNGVGRGVVGPMGAGSLEMPGVERALDRDVDDGVKMSRKDSAQSNGRLAPSPNLTSPHLAPSASPRLPSSARSPPLPQSPALGSTTVGGIGSPIGTGKQDTEVLQSFFNTLLKKDGRGTVVGGGGAGGQARTASGAGGKEGVNGRSRANGA